MILGGIWAGYFPGRSGGGVVTTSSGSGPDLREMSQICQPSMAGNVNEFQKSRRVPESAKLRNCVTSPGFPDPVRAQKSANVPGVSTSP
jgi:hypothetical protein